MFSGNVSSTVVILVVLVMNAVLGTIQHVKAEKSLESLKKLSSPNAKVIRDGVKKELPSQQIVPGDIIILEAGDMVVADCYILNNYSLQVNESSLTGESVNIEKSKCVLDENTALADRINMVYSGSLVTYGRAEVVVTATGMDTEIGRSDVSFDLWPGEVLGIVGESGSGKTTLLKSISARLTPQQGEIHYENRSLYAMSEADRRRLLRTEWGVVHQHPLDGLRRQVSAGGNIGERLMATGARHYGDIRATAQKWLEEVEIPANRIDDLPTTFSGGMQQRLQIARNLVTHPKLVFMDEPTGGLDVSVQARLLDLLRGLVVELNLAVVIVTHDLGVARLLADRLLVMKQGQVVESGLTDRVLDDPHHPYTQLLVSSVLQN